ncbi:MAG: hypothetical protein ACXVOH_03555 [Bacteroidia bacterium]
MCGVKKILVSVSALMLLSPVFHSCHKYPDDNFLSLRRPEKRILGSYKLMHYYINGADSVGNSKYQFYATGNRITFHHKISIDYQYDMGTYIDAIDGVAEFSKNRKQIRIRISDYLPLEKTNIFVVFYNSWQILKLYQNELWLSSTINGKSYEIHLKK